MISVPKIEPGDQVYCECDVIMVSLAFSYFAQGTAM
jgi:hypothetical protein